MIWPMPMSSGRTVASPKRSADSTAPAGRSCVVRSSKNRRMTWRLDSTDTSQIEAGDTAPQPADQRAFGFEDHRAGVVFDVDDDAVDFGGLRERDRLAQAAGRRRAPRRQINCSNGRQLTPGPDGRTGLGRGNLRAEHRG